MTTGNFKYKWPLVGNTQITDFLERSIGKAQVAGTYIFNGPDNLGKTTLAAFFAQSLLCDNYVSGQGELPCGICPSCKNIQAGRGRKKKAAAEEERESVHGDFHIVKKDKDKKNISVEQVREFVRALSMSSFLGTYKVGIIKHADKLSAEAANALLKTLEEPRANVVIVLITADLENLPLTIVSRSQVLNFRAVKTDIIYDYLINEYGATRSAAKNYSRICLGRPALAVKFFEDKDFYEWYLAQVKVFISFLGQDINARLSSIEDWAGKKLSGQEAAGRIKRTLEVWQGVVRDWLLLGYGLNDLVQHEILETELSSVKQKLSNELIFKYLALLEQSEAYLNANVNPKLVLENVAVGL